MLKPLGVNNHRVHLKNLAKLFANPCNAHFSSVWEALRRHFGREKTFRRVRRTGTSALGFLNQGSWGSGDDLAYKLTTHSHLRKDMLRSDFYVNRDFTIGRRDCSEAVALKMNLRSWQSLYRDCSSSLCQM